MKSKKSPKGKKGKNELSASAAKRRTASPSLGRVRPATAIPSTAQTPETTVEAAPASPSPVVLPGAPLTKLTSVSPAGPVPTPVELARKPSRVRKPVAMPPLLLEGDDPLIPEPPLAGPGERFVLGPVVPELRPPPAVELPGESLPKAYGTERLFLTPRDPHWLHAAWDLTPLQQRQYSELARGRQLIVRTYVDDFSGTPALETSIEPATWSCFLHVAKGGTTYVAELGYLDHLDLWQVIAKSSAAVTPPEAPSTETKLEFATIPAEVSLKALVEEVQHVQAAERPPLAPPQVSPPEGLPTEVAAPSTFHEIAPLVPAPPPTPIAPISFEAVAEPAPPPAATSVPAPCPTVAQPAEARPENAPAPSPARKANPPVAVPEVVEQVPSNHVPLLEAVRQLRTEGWTGLPEFPGPIASERPSPPLRHEEATQSVLLQSGSLEITELLRRHLAEELAPAAPGGAEVGLSTGPLAGPSSPAGPPETPAGERPFWFNVNAELIIYGATEKDARLAVGGREVRLRPDGTFSCRFALPDGQYPLLICATAADGTASRSARLQFSRDTQQGGEVGAHPQDPALKAPLEANFT